MKQTSRLLIFVLFFLGIIQLVSSTPIIEKSAAVVAITNQGPNCVINGCPVMHKNAALKSQNPLAPMAVVLAAGGVLVSLA